MDFENTFVQLAELVAERRLNDALALMRRDLPALSRARPDLSAKVQRAMALASDHSALRGMERDDEDDQSDLVREESTPELDIVPIWAPSVLVSLETLLLEREKEKSLRAAGLPLSRTALLIGPPGVGKTLAARWLARAMKKPLLTLDLATVMSSFLGRTGNNIRRVLRYAQQRQAVLLLDEFDAIAKRRDDASDVGELKRLVTVLLQAVDEWPDDGLLIAATNHPELLDPAIWRRFDRLIHFPLATAGDIELTFDQVLGPNATSAECRSSAATVFAGRGFADAVREFHGARRDGLVRSISLEEALYQRLAHLMSNAPIDQRLDLARRLEKLRMSQRRVAEITGLARDTLRTHGVGVRGNKSSRPSAMS
jgi:SpoVK/Ycf46/Vps4 family AAA+-type ATPase